MKWPSTITANAESSVKTIVQTICSQQAKPKCWEDDIKFSRKSPEEKYTVTLGIKTSSWQQEVCPGFTQSRARFCTCPQQLQEQVTAYSIQAFGV